MNLYETSIFIFRRDLRLNDNIGLIKALEQSKFVIPIFIFDPRQVGNENEYKSDNAVQFMIESIKDLEKQLESKKAKLYIFYGIAEKIISEIIKKVNAQAIFTNRDYTPFSINRDKEIERVCIKNKVDFKQFNDILLIQPEDIKTINGQEYKIFTPFFKKALQYKIELPKRNNHSNYSSISILQDHRKIFEQILSKTNNKLHVNGGTKNSDKILKVLKNFSNYKAEKDFPSIQTTNLSAYLKFGTCSIREVYHAIVTELGLRHDLIRQLFWRDFFTHVAYNSPFIFGQSYKEKFNKIKWQNKKDFFEKWCSGQTGFPIVDAGMRQLNETGFMHNRVRLIVGSFLVKDLHIDWRLGEKYFATKLSDYDPAVNNGNWQWVASTGTDAQPYFRIFNPWLQQKKFDHQCIYIKKWVKELKDIDPKIIHSLYKNEVKNYPKPIVEHNKEVIIAKKLYSNYI